MAKDLGFLETEDEVYKAVALDVRETTEQMGSSSVPQKEQRQRHVTAAFAQPQEALDCNTNQTLSKVNGPLSLYHIRSKGPVDLTWAKSKEFVNKIENCDTQKILHESFKIQACYYRLPRFTQFRVQLFDDGDKNPELPIVVELQRRDGDAFLTGLLFKGLRDFFRDSEDEPSVEQSPIISGGPGDGISEFQGLDLSKGQDDVSHWAEMMNQNVLESARSGANALALAAQGGSNLPYLLESHDRVVEGIKKLFMHSKDCPTIFGCSVLLSCLSVDDGFCNYCVENGVLLSIFKALHDWSGEGKYDVSSTQILSHLTQSLENIRDNIGNERWREILLNQNNQESLNKLARLLKDRKTGEVGQLLFQVLFADGAEEQAAEN